MGLVNLNSFPFACAIISDKMKIQEHNTLFEKLTGYNSKELKNTSLKTFIKESNFQKLKNEIISNQFVSEHSLYLENRNGEKEFCIIASKQIDKKNKHFLISIYNPVGREITSKSLQFLANDLSNLSGKGLFNNVCRFLSNQLNIDYVIIGEYIQSEEKIKVVGGFGKGRFLTPFEYPLKGSPCENVISSTHCRYDSKVQELFPDDYYLKEMDAVSYIGKQLHNNNGKPIGIMALVDSKPLINTSIIEMQFLIFANHVSKEIERIKTINTSIESEEKFKISFHNYPDSVHITSIPDEIFVDVNQSFLNTSEYTKDEVIGKSVNDLNFYLKPSDRKKFFNELNKKGKVVNYEIPFKIKSGKILNTLVTSEIIKIGDMNCLLSIVRDITDYKESINKIKESEQKLNSFFKAAPIGIGTVVNDVITFVNGAFCHMTGYSEDELLGKKSLILFAGKKEYSRVKKLKYEEIKRKGVGSTETKFKTKTGKLLDILISYTPVEIKNLSKGIIFTALNLSGKKKSDFIKEITYNISNAALSTHNLSDFIKIISQELGKIIDISNFYVAIYDQKTNTVSTPFVIDQRDSITTWNADKSITGYVIKKRKPLFINRSEIMELKNEGEINLIGTVSESWIGIPLLKDNEAIGALVVQDYDNPHAFNHEDFEILQFVSHQISISINRKRNEDKIEKLQKDLKLQIDIMPNGLIVWDEFFLVKSWNKAAERIFGFSENEAIGKHAYELIVLEDDQEKINMEWEEIQKNNSILSSSNKNITKSGDKIICEWSNTPLKKDDGSFGGVLSMVQDISEKIKYEQALKASEEKYNNLIKHSPDGIYIIDFEGNFLTANKFICDSLEIKAEEIKSKNIWDFIPDKYRKQYEIHLEKVITGQKIKQLFEYEVILKDESTMIIEIVAFPYYENNKLTGIQGIARDITFRQETEKKLKIYQEKLEFLVEERTVELKSQTQKLEESHKALSFLIDDVNESRKELEESNRQIVKLSQALEQSPSSVVITDTEGNIEYVNKQFSNITGYSPKEVYGKNPRILNSGTHLKSFYEELWDTIKSGNVWHGEICNLKKSGEKFWEHSSISPLRNKDNSISHFIAVKEDITERKKTEEKLKEYTKELEIFNKAMIDRELKIIEMKEEVNKLYKEMGKEIKYPPVWRNS